MEKVFHVPCDYSYNAGEYDDKRRRPSVTQLKYEYAYDVEALARDIVSKLGMSWIKMENVGFIRSTGSKSHAVARIYGLPRSFQVAFKMPASYVIEVISEKYDKLPYEEKVEVIIHELLHISSSFSGGLRPHGKIVNARNVKKLKEKYLKSLTLKEKYQFL